MHLYEQNGLYAARLIELSPVGTNPAIDLAFDAKRRSRKQAIPGVNFVVSRSTNARAFNDRAVMPAQEISARLKSGFTAR